MATQEVTIAFKYESDAEFTDKQRAFIEKAAFEKLRDVLGVEMEEFRDNFAPEIDLDPKSEMFPNEDEELHHAGVDMVVMLDCFVSQLDEEIGKRDL
jgi:hypothetical protein